MAVVEALPQIDLSKYRGQWVVIYEDEIIAHNTDLTKIQKDIDRCKQTPTITKIPKQDVLIF